MASLLIDTSAAATIKSFSEIVPIEGTEYLLQFYWSDREQAWYLSIANQDETPLASWIRLVADSNLLRRFRSFGTVPPGYLMAWDSSGQSQEIATQADLGNRVLLTYITSDDPILQGANLLVAP